MHVAESYNKTMALVDSKSRTVNPPHGYLVLSVVSIYASPNLDIHGVKFDSKLIIEDHLRVLFLVSVKEFVF